MHGRLRCLRLVQRPKRYSDGILERYVRTVEASPVRRDELRQGNDHPSLLYGSALIGMWEMAKKAEGVVDNNYKDSESDTRRVKMQQITFSQIHTLPAPSLLSLNHEPLTN